jgi:hypothetical protein
MTANVNWIDNLERRIIFIDVVLNELISFKAGT